MRNRLAAAVVVVGTVVSVAWGYSAIRSVLSELDAGGGIFGSSDTVGLLAYVLPTFLTLWLAGRVRTWGGLARTLRRLYLFATLALVALFGIFVIQLFLRTELSHGRIGWALLVSAFVAGAIWLPLQAFFAAGFLGLLIKPREA